MGPVGFEPTTKGFTLPRRFHREWTISSPAHQGACVWVREAPSLLSRALKPSGSLCTFRRCTGGSAQGCHGPRGSKVSLNSSRPLHAFPREGTSHDESPALTAVLQAQRPAIVAAPSGSETKQRAAPVALRAAASRKRLIDRALEPGDLTHAVMDVGVVHGTVVRCARGALMRCVHRTSCLPLRVRVAGNGPGRHVWTCAQQECRGTGGQGDQKRPHHPTLLPSLVVTLAWPSPSAASGIGRRGVRTQEGDPT